jgi:signal transduction histidine kinase
MNNHIKKHFLPIIIALIAISWSSPLLLLLWHEANWHIAIYATIAAISTSLLLVLYNIVIPKKYADAARTITDPITDFRQNGSKSIPLDNAPEFMHPLIDSINQVLARDEDQLAQEHAFTSTASHELRTPLAGIRLQAQIAQRAKDATQLKNALANIITSIDRSTRLVEQLLNLSRLTQRSHHAKLEQLDLRTVCENSVKNLQYLAEKNNVQLSLVIDEQALLVRAHEESLTVLLQNLIENALHNTPGNGVICVRANRVDDTTVKLIVSDSGVGVPEAERQRIMQHFQKVGSTRNGNQGSGLGLTIVNRVAELHDSSVVLSESEIGGLAVSLDFNLTALK